MRVDEESMGLVDSDLVLLIVFQVMQEVFTWVEPNDFIGSLPPTRDFWVAQVSRDGLGLNIECPVAFYS